MARPTNKVELINAATEQFAKLWKIIDSMDEAKQNMDFCFDADKMGSEAHWKRDKNLRDVLVHLYEWHQLLLMWEDSNSKGQSMPFLPSPYTWKTYGEMNVELWKKHQNTPLNQAKLMLGSSHEKVLELIQRYTDEQLFTKKFYNWTGTSSLAQYCISATVSHYEWGIKKLKAQIKAIG